ncbi:MAG: phosphate ABC transporter permease subunit PstC [Oscillochloridaceae bacterium umkhey_bin13]
MAEAKAEPRTQATSNWAYRTQHGDLIFWLLTLFFALVIIGLVVAVGVVTFGGSAEARERYGLSFLTNVEWNPIETDLFPATYGAWPAMRGTLLSSLLALVLAAPTGVAIGVFLSELCPLRIRGPLGFTVELLAAIPSVIYGLWGVAVFAPWFTTFVAVPISESVGGAIPWLAGPVAVSRGLIVTGVILAIMILPTVAAITRDVLQAVPNNQRDVMLSLGATRWEVIWLSVLPYARAGIIGGIMLGLGRALGETMAATMLIGNSTRIEESLFAPATTAAALVASELPNANDTMHESALIYLALVLFGITLFLNLIARYLVWQTSRGPAGARA